MHLVKRTLPCWQHWGWRWHQKEPLLWVLKRDEEEATGKLQITLGNEGPCQAECAAETVSWDESRQKSSETVVNVAAYFLCTKNVLELRVRSLQLQWLLPSLGPPSAHQDPPQFFCTIITCFLVGNWHVKLNYWFYNIISTSPAPRLSNLATHRHFITRQATFTAKNLCYLS